MWHNNSIFRTNCAIACGTRAYMLRGFLRMSREGNGVRNSRNFSFFWPTTQRVDVCWNFCLSIFVVSCSSLSDHISLTKLCSDGCFFYTSCTLLHFKFHICWRLTAFPLHSKKLADIFRYSRASGLHIFLSPLATRLRGICQSIATEKQNKIIATLRFAWIVSNAWCFIKA